MTRGAYQRAAWLHALCLYALCMGGCSSTPLVEALCGNELDEDRDQLFDCQDPDCHASVACLGSRPGPAIPPEDAGRAEPRDAQPEPPIDSGPGGPPVDGGDPDASAPPDAQVIDPTDEDAGTDPCERCASDETCVDGQCRPAGAPTSGAYYLQVLRATVPNMDVYSRCYDPCFVPLGWCMCAPDPYVRVILKRDGAEQRVGQTAVVQDMLEPTFPANQFELELFAGDVLRFDVMDDDPDRDVLLYDCNADLSRVSPSEPMATELRCGVSQRLGPIETVFRVTAMLTPRPVQSGP